MGAHCLGVSTGGEWSWDFRKIKFFYQLLGIAGRITGHQDVYKKQGLCTLKTINGQHCRSSVHKQDGRYSLAGFIESSTTTVGLVHPEQNRGICSTLARTPECQSGLGIEEFSRFERLETGPINVLGINENMGLDGDLFALA